MDKEEVRSKVQTLVKESKGRVSPVDLLIIIKEEIEKELKNEDIHWK